FFAVRFSDDFLNVVWKPSHGRFFSPVPVFLLQCSKLCLKLGRLFVVTSLLFVVFRERFRCDCWEIVTWKEGFEEGPEPVVVCLKNGIELVIMATGALQPHSQKHIRSGIGQF